MKKKKKSVDTAGAILAPRALGYNHAAMPGLSFQGVTEVLRRRPRAEGRDVPGGGGRGARARRGERRRQVDAHARARGDRASRRRTARLGRAQARPAQPARRPRPGDRHGLPGDAALPEPHRQRQHLRRARGDGLRRPAPRAGDARAHGARCSTSCTWPSRPTPRSPPQHRPPAARPDRARAGLECRILILDEPTTCAHRGGDRPPVRDPRPAAEARASRSSTSPHKLDEVFRLCQRITVLRDGEHVGTFERRGTTPREIVRSMVGRDIDPAARVPRHGARGRAGRALVDRPHASPVVRGREPAREGGRDRGPLRPRGLRAGPSCWRRSSACTGRMPAPCPSAAAPCSSRRRSRPSARGWPSSRRSAIARGSSST